MKRCIRVISAGAVALAALVFVWQGVAAANEASCAAASGYVIQFCVNVPSALALQRDTTVSLDAIDVPSDVLVKASTRGTVAAAVEVAPAVEGAPVTANRDGVVQDQAALTPAVADSPIAIQPPRAPLLARSYPRSFWTYDTLVEYASAVADEQHALNESLAALAVRRGLPQARADLIDDGTGRMDGALVAMFRSQLANDAAAREKLLASGAAPYPQTRWRLPLIGEITQDFGPSSFRLEPPLEYRGDYYKHFHAGTDIAAPWGSPIYAPAGGTVVFAGTMGDGAVVVMIAHDAGLVSLYAHLDGRTSPPPVKAGDTVQGGDRIGTVGLTGITTGPHLHWGVWRNGELVDPLSLILD